MDTEVWIVVPGTAILRSWTGQREVEIADSRGYRTLADELQAQEGLNARCVTGTEFPAQPDSIVLLCDRHLLSCAPTELARRTMLLDALPTDNLRLRELGLLVDRRG